jgi:hypothetical protein
MVADFGMATAKRDAVAEAESNGTLPTGTEVEIETGGSMCRGCSAWQEPAVR